MKVKVLKTVNEIKDFVNRGKVVYFTVNEGMTDVDISLPSPNIVVYDNVKDVYYLECTEFSSKYKEKINLIIGDYVTSWFTVGIFTTPLDYVELHFKFKKDVQKWFGLSYFYEYRVYKIFDEGECIGYKTYLHNLYHFFNTGLFEDVYDVYNKLKRDLLNYEEIYRKFYFDFKEYEKDIKPFTLFRYVLPDS